MVKTKIYICATIKNRFKNLNRLCESLAEIEDLENVQFSLSDYGSDDGDIRALLEAQPFPCTHVLLQGSPFNRSQGLNFAILPLEPAPEDMVFFIDVDMLVPKDLPVLIREKVKSKRSWFPICYSLHKGKKPVVKRNSRYPRKANGWWRTEGKGMCAFLVEDFIELGKWNERTGITYGKEDGLIARRSVKAGIKMVRDRCVGLFHVWHPTGKYRTKHHMNIVKKNAQGKRIRSHPKKAPQPKIEIWHSCPVSSE